MAMSSIVLNFLVDGLISGAGWLVRVVRSAIAPAIVETAVRGGKEMVCLTPSRKAKRRVRKQMKHLANRGDIDELIRAYRSLGHDVEIVDLRIDAVMILTATDPVAAEPVLREIIAGCDHPWLVLAALDRAAKHRLTGLLDCVNDARDDHRSVVAKLAEDVHRRLVKADSKLREAATCQ